MLAGTGLRAEGAEAKGRDDTLKTRQVQRSPLAKKGSTRLKAFTFAEPPWRLEVVGCMTLLSTLEYGRKAETVRN